MMVINGLACHEMQIRQIMILKSNSCINFAQVGPTLDQDVMISVGYNKHFVFTENTIPEYRKRETVLLHNDGQEYIQDRALK